MKKFTKIAAVLMVILLSSFSMSAQTLTSNLVCDTEYQSGAINDLSFNLAIETPDYDYGTYFEVELPAGFEYVAATPINYVVPYYDAGNHKVIWDGWFYYSAVPENFNFFITVDVDDLVSGPQTENYLIKDYLGNEFPGDYVIYEQAQVPGKIEGYVTSAQTGQAIHGAQVTATIASGGVDYDYIAYTSGNGHYIMQGVVPGDYNLQAIASGYSAKEELGVIVQPGQPTQVDFTLDPLSAKLAGYVYEADQDGQPIQGATITADGIRDGVTITYSDVTDENGFYEITDMVGGSYNVTAEANFYESYTYQGWNVPAGYTTYLNFDLLPSGPILISAIPGIEEITLIWEPIPVEKTGHFDFGGGNAADPVWTIYIGGATVSGVDLVAGDEIAIYDGETMVGVIELTQVCNLTNQFENALPVFQTLTAGPGYTPGNEYSFKAWSEGAQEEYDEFEIILSDPYGGAWTGLVFPAGDGQYSMVELDFAGGPLPTLFNVYYEDGTLVVGDIEALTYTDMGLIAGQEYCYYVTQILEGGGESAASNVLCATTLAQMYTVTTEANPPEGGTTTGDGTFAEGTMVTVNASPNTDWEFINWTVDGTEVSIEAEYTFTIMGDILLVANFEYSPPPEPFSIPFCEYWDSGDFETNYWTPDGTNWIVATTFGNPLPSAKFGWSPQVTNYSMALSSWQFDATALTEVELNYDLYLSNYSLATIEGLLVEVYDGAAWYEVANYTNVNGSIPWTSFTHDVSAIAAGNIINVRFVAYGEDSYNINNWNIDNICLKDEVTPPGPVLVSVTPGIEELTLLWEPIPETKTDHFNFEGGSAADPVWTIYLGGATVGGTDLVAGDEIAVFDGDLMVGVIELTQICTPTNQFDNAIPVFSTLTSGPGYTPGNAFSFIAWSEANQEEYPEFEVTLSDPYGDAWIELVFPTGDGQYSMAELEFVGGPTPTLFNVYYQDGTLVAGGVEGNTYTDMGLIAGDEYCYYVTQILEGGIESGPSNVECGIPEPGDPIITYDPDHFDVQLYVDETTQDILNIGNIGDGPLLWDIEVLYPPADLVSNIEYPEVDKSLVSAVSTEPSVGNMSNSDDDVILQYDDGINTDAIGLTSGGDFMVSTYWPAATMAQYAGTSISEVEVYISSVGSIDFTLTIWGAGSAAAPGAIIYEQTFNPTVESWYTIILDTPVLMDGDDIWIGYTVVGTLAGDHPAGCDAGPAVAGYGDMISLNGVTWAPLSGYGLDYNWNIHTLLVGEVIVPWLTVGPLSGMVDPQGSEEVTLNFNAGDYPAGTVLTADLVLTSNDPITPVVTIPVSLEVLSEGLAPILVSATPGVEEVSLLWEAIPEEGTDENLNEGFETWPPVDWTIVQGECSPTNDITQNGDQFYTGAYSARFSSYSSCATYDEYLITPELNTTAGDQTISFWYKKYQYGSEVFTVGWSSTGTDVATDFTWGPEVSVTEDDWLQYVNTDLPVGTKYVAIHYYSDYMYYLYLDDVEGPALATGSSTLFNVYYEDGTLVEGDVAGLTYTDTELTAGQEYCYYVTQILEGGIESEHSNILCATPFPPTEYTVTTEANPPEGGTTAGDGIYEGGTEVTVYAYPNTDWEFINWTVDGTEVSIEAEYTFTIMGDILLVANFEYSPPPEPFSIPFCEYWDSGDFETNYWTPEGNWMMSAIGNPAPSAMFNWSPGVTSYSLALSSWQFDATALSTVVLDYDLFLSNYSLSTIEGLLVEVYDGAAWYEVANYTNVNGNIPWTSFTHDVSAIAAGNIINVRFVAYGENSFNINNWNIDNICLKDEVTPPGPVLVSVTPGVEELTLLWEPIPETKTDHFNFEGGSAADPVWTVYIGGATVGGIDMVAGDEIAVFDGDLMVGVIELTQVCTPTNQFENAIPVFSTLTSGPGYVPGNAYSFKAWSEANQEEYDEFDITLADPYGGAWMELVFPAGDGQYSMAELEFGGYIPPTLFNVYYEDGTLVAGDVEGLTYTDMGLIGGQEYCYYVTQILEGGIESGPSNVECGIPIDPDYTVTTEANPPEGGTTAGDGVYPAGTEVTVYAYPNTDWEFINWTVDGVEVSINPEYTFFVEGDILIVANFEYNPPVGPVLVSATGGIEEVTLVWEPIPETKTNHFNFEGGDPSSPVWTIYLGGATFDGMDMQAGDEIGIYDADLLVGVFTLDQVCTPDNQFDNDFIAFSVLTNGPGYVEGNAFTMVAWDESVQLESSSFEYTFSNPYGDAWTGDVFPSGDGQYSMAEFTFTGGIAPTLFNVYYQNGTLVAGGIEGTTYTDMYLIAGQEYCYYVTQILEGGIESAASNILCAIPTSPTVPFDIPFCEYWDSDDFETNNWTPEGNWMMSTIGNPAPSAMFHWSPQATNYSFALTSWQFDATALDVVNLTYDLFLNNYSLSTIEGLSVEVFDGTTWYEVANYTNENEDIPWTSFSHDVSQYVAGYIFNVRFTAYGEDTYNINNWNIDNICLGDFGGPIITTINDVTTGDTEFVVPITVENFMNVAAISLTMNYNMEELVYVDYQNIHPVVVGMEINDNDGNISATWITTEVPASIPNDEVLFELVFQAPEVFSSIITWDEVHSEYADPDLVVLEAEFVDGLVTILSSSLSGYVYYGDEYETGLINTDVGLVDAYTLEVEYVTQTDEFGFYQFDVIHYGEYIVTPNIGLVWDQSANSTDALAIMYDFIGTQPLYGLYWEAGDVTDDGVLNAVDALAVQERYIGFIPEFPAGDWITEANIIDVPTVTYLDVMALYYGDVNGTADLPYGTKSAETSVMLAYEGEINLIGDIIDIPVSVKNSLEVGAVSLVFNYPASLEIIDVTINSDEKVFFNAENGELSISWASLNSLKLMDGEQLINIAVKTNNASNFDFTLNDISELADATATAHKNVIITMPSLLDGEYSLSNYPNPFNNTTNIQYVLPEDGYVILKVYNLHGELVRTLVNSQQAANNYEVKLDAMNIPAGVYTYRLEVQGAIRNFVLTNRMVITE